MTVEGVDLELSLGLGGASGSPRLPPLQPNQMLSPVYPPSPFTSLAYERAQWCHLLAPSSTEGRSPGRSPPFPVGIDINKETEEEEAGECSPNSNVSAAVSGGGGGNKRREGDLQLERSCPRGTSDEEDGGEGEGSRKKLRLSKEQSAVLEERFQEHNSLDPKQKQALAKQLNLRPRQVEVWFQNRRARSKLKQTEVECGLLRRCCDRMREENRRLQKEAQELRALKLSPPDQLYVDMVTPAATTLSICSSCERVASDAPTQPGAAIPASTTPASPAVDDQHQLQRFHPDLLPRHLPLEHGSPMPVACAGQSLPRVPAHLVSSIDAPPPR